MLGHDAFDLRVPHGIDDVVATVPAGGPARGIGPDHVDLGATVFLGDRVGVFDVLVRRGYLMASVPPEMDRRIVDPLFYRRLGKELLPPGRGGSPVGFQQPLSGN